MSVIAKCCCTCKQQRPSTEFYRDGTQADGLGRRCKACQCAANARSRARDPEPARAAARRWHRKNSEHRAQYKTERKVALVDEYVAATMGFRVADCPPPLIELKRAHMQVKRAIKETAK